MGKLDGKVAVITGGGSGIGKGIARAFAAEGCNLVLAARNAQRLQSAAKELARVGAVVVAHPADITDEAQVVRLFAQTTDRFHRLDILVNNAGAIDGGRIDQVSLEAWSRVIATGVTGAFLCTREASKMMTRSRSGRIINVSSVAGLTGDLKRANYAAAKAGLVGLTKATARDLATFGITVNAVAPGYIETDFLSGIDQETRKKMMGLIPLRRLGRPEEVAELIAFLAGESAGYVTGTVFVIDGGLSM
jgi:3-oxoacyl-[acyl-carrier protein] reductase